jgi:hypothetical protein
MTRLPRAKDDKAGVLSGNEARDTHILTGAIMLAPLPQVADVGLDHPARSGPRSALGSTPSLASNCAKRSVRISSLAMLDPGRSFHSRALSLQGQDAQRFRRSAIQGPALPCNGVWETRTSSGEKQWRTRHSIS